MQSNSLGMCLIWKQYFCLDRLQPSQTNFRIAEDFIMSNIEAHTFPDTNDNEIKRQIKNLKDKFFIHNQSDKVQRLDYLQERFLKCKLKNTGGGFGEIHYSVLRMLLLLQNNPTGVDEIDQFNNQRVYLTKEEMQAVFDKQMEEKLKVKTEEDQAIQVIQQEWEQEIEGSSSDEDNSDWDDDSDKEREYKERKQQQLLREQAQQQQDQNDIIKESKERQIVKVQGREVEESQMFFGGMPIGTKIKAPPIIKTIEKKSKAKKVKKFSINQFLDKYLSELQPPKNPYENYLEKKKQNEAQIEKDKQQKLKTLLNIRTFDEIQQQLSQRVQNQDLNQSVINQSQENPQLTSYLEPLNLLKDYALKQKEALGFWHHNTVTERQLVMDTILLMQQLESSTYSLDIDKSYKLRNKVQLSHVSPKMLEGFIDKFVKMASIIRETNLYIKGLKNQQAHLGMVFESLIYKLEQVRQRFDCELSDLQQIALLQAGQLAKQQLNLNPLDQSMVSRMVNPEDPITLLRLHTYLESFVFKKIQLLHDLMRNGIMDYLILEDDSPQNMMLQELNNNSAMNDSQDQSHDLIAANYLKADGRIPDIQIEKIKPADRVTFLLNYLYLVIKNNQLLQNFSEINILKEIFIAALQPYISIMADWVNKGELKDPYQEFFIKANPKVFSDANDKISSKNQWKESFIFRTINLRELMGQVPAGGAQSQQLFMPVVNDTRVEISIPIFLRPMMNEILSIGKSIKIVRYLDNINIVKDVAFSDFTDFKSLFNNNLESQLLVINTAKESDKKTFSYQQGAEPNQLLQECANQNLNNIWDPSYVIGDIMSESTHLKDYRELMQVAPFGWNNNYENGKVGIFQIPQVQQLDSSFASTQYSNNNDLSKENSPEKDGLRMLEDVEMMTEKQDEQDNRNSSRKVMIDEDKYVKLSNKYNYSYQELANYEGSMNYYQAFKTFEYLMRNPLNQDEIDQSTDATLYKFKRFSIENFIKDCLLAPLSTLHSKTCSRFFKRLNLQSNLVANLKILRQIFFMQAGAPMHQYATKIFKQLDKGLSFQKQEQLYMVNGHFNETVCQPLKNVEFIEKMSVLFLGDSKDAISSTQSINGLDFMFIQFKSEWPLEIILDNDTIKQYNLILQQLMKIKRVNYVLSLNDYWLKPSTFMLQKYDQLTIRDQILYNNRAQLDQILHQLQVFQKELLHFSNNLEYYLKTRAIQGLCNELDAKLNDLQNDQEDTKGGEGRANMIDMDALVQIHQDFLMNIMRLCLLDSKSKMLLDVVLKVLQISLNFRQLCRKYLLTQDSNIDDGDLLNESGDLGLNLDNDDKQNDLDDEINKKSNDDTMGRGLLRIDSLKFMDRATECQNEITEMRKRFRTYMQMLIETLKKYTKKGVFSYLDEAFTRFNFNNYYMSRDREGLD